MVMGSCVLSAPNKNDIASSTVSTNVGVNVNFTTTLSAAQIIEMVNENEYDLRLKTGNWETKPKSYTYSDKNIELQVDFSDNLPIIARPEKKSYIYFTIKNTGGGLISDIKAGDFSLTEISSAVVSCETIGGLSPVNNVFPRIACTLNLPSNVDYISNHMIVINLNYNYEIRKDIPIKIVR
jgi:hypothetical protein